MKTLLYKNTKYRYVYHIQSYLIPVQNGLYNLYNLEELPAY
uniref:Uncharacterized protein n=1 Tax=Siphoviridae sp. ctiOl67 TaxID=2825622 RepID=A0A8S5QJP5_9CAUD|nr:MAG TPA: hypothetical protein [Siphoviridae sp. ctiOl67]